MSFWSKLTGLLGRRSGLDEGAFDGVRWIAADQSPIGVEVLDCWSFAQLPAMDEPPRVSGAFRALAGGGGADVRGRSPEDPVSSACDLRYACPGGTSDGVLFRGEEMEDKWDVHLFDGWLYFTRSSTGKLMYRARIELTPEEVIVRSVEAPRALMGDDPRYLVRVVDYLIRSHLFRIPAPHPLPPSLGRDPRRLAIFSFSQYGRRGLFGTFAETIGVELPLNDQAGGA